YVKKGVGKRATRHGNDHPKRILSNAGPIRLLGLIMINAMAKETAPEYGHSYYIGAFFTFESALYAIMVKSISIEQEIELPMDETIRVLVVDDDAEIRETLADILELEGYSVCQAANGTEALKAFQVQPFPIVLLDLCMPGADGLSTLTSIKKLSYDTRVIVITGVDKPDLCAKALSEGAEAIFRKPLDVAAFLPLLLE
ncbi:MAG: response regulator, partial [Chloroflexi bacterium]|nr:response regulator [Chloroflexota bacterium]